jgi:hypothetical protein
MINALDKARVKDQKSHQRKEGSALLGSPERDSFKLSIKNVRLYP